MIYYMTKEHSVLDCILVAIRDKQVCAVLFSNNSDQALKELHIMFPQEKCLLELSLQSIIEEITYQINNPQAHYQPSFLLSTDGTEFQQQVWKILKKIPLGETLTYLEIAKKIGKPKVFRAVANACGANKIAYLIPCHRVIASHGQLAGYRWAIERKKYIKLVS